MYIEFDKDYLRELYELGRTNDKRHRYQPEVIRGYQKAVFLLSSANAITDLFQNNALNYEVFNEQIITLCRLLDISNHYK